MDKEKILTLSTKKPTKLESRYEEVREKTFQVPKSRVWDRQKEDGFSTVPRTLSLIMVLLRELSEKKHDPSQVYCELWCRVFDRTGMVESTNEEDIAYASGYTTPSRSVRSWRERIDQLEKLGFIMTRGVGSAKYRYILILHPHQVIAALREDGKISDTWYSAYEDRMRNIGGEIPEPKHKTKSARA